MRRFRDSRCVFCLGSRHRCASARPSCRQSEYTRTCEQKYVLAHRSGKTYTGTLVSASCLDDITQRLNCQVSPLPKPPRRNAPHIPTAEAEGFSARLDNSKKRKEQSLFYLCKVVEHVVIILQPHPSSQILEPTHVAFDQ